MKNYSNFSVIKDIYVFIVHWDTSYINFTKVKSLDQIPRAISHFSTITQLSCYSEYEVHNIIANGSLKLKKNISEIPLQPEILNNYFIRKNRSFSPALFLKNHNGTFMIFQSGKFSFLGFQSLTCLIKTSKDISDLLNNCGII